MPACIYCGNQLIVGASDGTRPSLEHIIQWSLGGSGQVATNDACVSCNSKLGETVDADFISEPALGLIRLQFGTVGYSGKVPSVDLQGRSTDTNEPARISMGRNNIDISQEPVVIRQPDEAGGEQVLVAGEPDDAERIARGILEAARKRGLSIQDTFGRAITDVGDLISTAQTEVSAKFSIPFPVNDTAIHTGLIKIAYGFGHLILGPAWSSSAADLRAIATGCATANQVRAAIKGAEPEIRAKMFGMAPTSHDHLIAVVPSGRPMILVSLFGDPLLTIAVPLARHDRLEEIMLGNDRVAVTVNPTSRSAEWMSYQDFLRHAGFGLIANALQTLTDKP